MQLCEKFWNGRNGFHYFWWGFQENVSVYFHFQIRWYIELLDRDCLIYLQISVIELCLASSMVIIEVFFKRLWWYIDLCKVYWVWIRLRLTEPTYCKKKYIRSIQQWYLEITLPRTNSFIDYGGHIRMLSSEAWRKIYRNSINPRNSSKNI